ncbi:hypothetical protein AVEN_72100-1, partial [Araneus ventricosus]
HNIRNGSFHVMWEKCNVLRLHQLFRRVLVFLDRRLYQRQILLESLDLSESLLTAIQRTISFKDKAAKLATAPTNSSTPLTDFKKYTKLLFYTKWQRQWDTETENKLHAVKPHVQPWSSLMNRKADTLLTRLRVGHTRYTHRHLLFGEQAPMCSQCNCSMSVQHILYECPNFNSQRLNFLRTNSVDLSLLLGEAPHVNLFAFLRSIGFYPHI